MKSPMSSNDHIRLPDPRPRAAADVQSAVALHEPPPHSVEDLVRSLKAYQFDLELQNALLRQEQRVLRKRLAELANTLAAPQAANSTGSRVSVADALRKPRRPFQWRVPK